MVFALVIASTLPFLVARALGAWNDWRTQQWQAHALLLPVNSTWHGFSVSFLLGSSAVAVIVLVAGLNLAPVALVLAVTSTWPMRSRSWPVVVLLLLSLLGLYACLLLPRSSSTLPNPTLASATSETEILAVALGLLVLAIGSAWFLRRFAVTRSAAAGWYADPTGNAAWRWWDGNNWTEHQA